MPARVDKLEALIGTVLIIGIVIAGAVVAVGGALYLLHYGSMPVHYGVYTGEPAELRTIVGVIGAAAHMSGRAIIQFGIVVLVAMQIVRVAFTLWLFKATHDRVFVGISLFVLALLGYSLFGQG